MNGKIISTVLLVVLVGFTSWTFGSVHGRRLAETRCGAKMRESMLRLNSSSVTELPATCESGDFVFKLTDNKYYVCAEGKWIYPNYSKYEKAHGEPR